MKIIVDNTTTVEIDLKNKISLNELKALVIKLDNLNSFKPTRHRKFGDISAKVIELKKQGMRNRDIAEVVGIPQSSVGTRVWMARKNGALQRD